MNQVITFAAKGGVLMIPLAICSIISLSIILKKLMMQRYNKIIPKKMVTRIENISSYEDIIIKKAQREKSSSPLSSLINHIIENSDMPLEELKEELADETRQEVRELDKGLTALKIIATVSPVIGLLGTVIGMIKVFTVISAGGIADPEVLSAGISEALITTATGLTIAIPSLIMFHYFNNKNENLLLDMEKHLNKLLRKVKFIKFRRGNETGSN